MNTSLVVFHCGECDNCEKTIEHIKSKGINPSLIGVHEHPDLVKKLNIRGYPTTLLLQDGETELERVVSYQEMVLNMVINKHLGMSGQL